MTSTEQHTISQEENVPVLLLKTKSSPNDGYEEYFSTSRGLGFDPTFVPVLEHRFLDEGLDVVRGLIVEKEIRKGAKYGGLIFTSQRAVEAFAKLVDEGRENESPNWPHLPFIPIYTVGPATTRALRSIHQNPPLQIFGSETGNGEALAHYMLDHYGSWYTDQTPKPPLLFLVGETRRDIIPKTLMDSTLPDQKRIQVDELVIYGTGVMQSFEADFASTLKDTEKSPVRWVVVFSPTGCESMLRTLDMLDSATGRIKTGERGGGCGVRKGRRSTYVATIGPTTRDYLRKTFGFEPDVCAARPTPEGVGEGIGKFMKDIKMANTEP